MQIKQNASNYLHIDSNKENKGKENWRGEKSLGSLLDESRDVERSIILSSVALNHLFNFWDSISVSVDLKIKLYRAYVKSVLLYNSGTW